MAIPKVVQPRFDATLPRSGERVRVRGWTRGEEKVLLTAQATEDPVEMQRAMYEVVERVTEGDVAGDTHAVEDVLHVFLEARKRGVGESSNPTLRCSACKEFQQERVLLTDVFLEGREGVDPVVDCGPTEEGENVHLRLRPVTADLTLEAKRDDAKDHHVFRRCVEEVWTGSESFDLDDEDDASVEEFYASLPPSAHRQVERFLRDVGVQCLDHSWTCKNCGSEESVRLRGVVSFFV